MAIIGSYEIPDHIFDLLVKDIVLSNAFEELDYGMKSDIGNPALQEALDAIKEEISQYPELHGYLIARIRVKHHNITDHEGILIQSEDFHNFLEAARPSGRTLYKQLKCEHALPADTSLSNSSQETDQSNGISSNLPD